MHAKEIQGRRYTVNPLPAGKLIRVGADLAKMVGSSLKGLNVVSAKEALKIAGTLIADLTAGLDGETLERSLRIIAEHTTVENEDGAPMELHKCFDKHFQGKPDALLEWGMWAIEVNFAPLFKRLLAQAEKAGVAKEAARAASP
jgi:hypothetical protein